MPVVVQEWIGKTREKPIPVFTHTAQALQKLCANKDTPLQKLVDTVEQDPGLTVQLLRICNGQDGQRPQREITSVQQAIMLVGAKSIASIAASLPTLDQSLTDLARSQLQRVFCRAYHAGVQAVAWARLRDDNAPEEIFAASQLHFLGEMILAMYAPEKLQETFSLRREMNIAPEEAQYVCLGFTFDQLALEIARTWSLPQLVIGALQAENASYQRGFVLKCAVQLARNATIDWYSDRMAGIYKSIAECLNMEVDEIIREAHQLAVSVAKNSSCCDALQSAALLPRIHNPAGQLQSKQTLARDCQADICLTPQISILQETLTRLRNATAEKQDFKNIIYMCLEGMRTGIGLNRVVFATHDAEQKALHAAAVVGAEDDPVFNRFSIRLDKPNLFVMLVEQPQAICINDSNRENLWPTLPREFQELIGTNSFAAMSIFVNKKLLGLLYADRHTSACQIDSTSYNYFKKLSNSLAQAISYVGK